MSLCDYLFENDETWEDMSEIIDISPIKDKKGYLILYKSDIKTANSVIEINMKKSKRIVFVELCQIANSVTNRITVAIQDFDEFVIVLQNMLIYSKLNPRPYSTAEETKPDKGFTLKTEMSTSEKRHYSFELIFNNSEKYLNLICQKTRKVTTISIFASDLESFIMRCEYLLKIYSGMRGIKAYSRKKYPSIKPDQGYLTDWPNYSKNQDSGISRIDSLKCDEMRFKESIQNLTPRKVSLNNKLSILETFKGRKTNSSINERIKEKLNLSINGTKEGVEILSNIIQEILEEIVDIQNEPNVFQA